jgi:glucose-1-phosphate thymidylyltransferase
MIAVILCAGFATRMYPLTRDFPKPLLPVRGRPVLNYLMDQIADLPELQTAHIVTNGRFIHHFQEWQKARFAEKQDKSIKVQLHNDGAVSNDHRLGASADLQFVFHLISRPSKVLVTAGDNIFRFSLLPLWESFIKRDRHYIVALPENDPQKLKKTGVPELGANNRVLKLHEKPQHPLSNWFCPPLYFLQPSAWPRLDSFIRHGGNKDAPGHFIAHLCQKETVYAFKPDGFRIDIGDLASYRQADAHF